MASPAPDYDFRAIEAKWQASWETSGVFRGETHPEGETYFVLVFPPYPNGAIHMGHVRSYTIGDAVARYKRLCGKSVLHPIGFDAFGLPNELEAVKQGIGPEELTRRNIENMARQLRRLGYSYDWSRAIVTIDPDYYRWNQWLFVTLMEQGLVYRKAARVQWCPSCRTSLANEQVIDGRCWRCATEVASRFLEQWFYRLRAYAEELWSETAQGVFPDNIATMIRDWLGRTEGAELDFPVCGSDARITVFTTKPELAYGATYLALPPHDPRVAALLAGTGLEGRADRLRRTVEESSDPSVLTDGLDTGVRAIHPLTGGTIPVWLAAYVDPGLATGAIMGNPCHDRSDHAFGHHHGIPGRAVVSPDGTPWDHQARGPFVEDGVLHGYPGFEGRPSLEAREDVVRQWESQGIGRAARVFAVRDWLVSRQRAWGTPIPVVHCPSCGAVAVPKRDLPVRLPEGLRDAGEGNPLDRRDDFLSCTCPTCAAPARRDTDTMDTFIDTAWYYLRSTNPGYAESLCDPEAVARWGPADLYVGGIEICVPIMLYGSFIAKGLRDARQVGFSLPCRRLLAHDMVLHGGRKMSKSLGNTVEPEDLVDRVGADSVRLLILSLAPPLKKIEWSDTRLQGCHRYLRRVFNLGVRQTGRAARIAGTVSPETEAELDLARETNDTVRAVTQDLERLQPNTCITALVKFLYRLEELEDAPSGTATTILAERAVYDEAYRTLLVLLSPFAPHLCEELWERLGNRTAVTAARWPKYNVERAAGPTQPITIKVNAKPVVRLEIPVGATREEVLALAHNLPAVRERVGERPICREIYVPGQVLNIVVAGEQTDEATGRTGSSGLNGHSQEGETSHETRGDHGRYRIQAPSHEPSRRALVRQRGTDGDPGL